MPRERKTSEHANTKFKKMEKAGGEKYNGDKNEDEGGDLKTSQK